VGFMISIIFFETMEHKKPKIGSRLEPSITIIDPVFSKTEPVGKYKIYLYEL
jgi:hypothetical protein